MFCPKCGTNVEDGSGVCSNCGLDFSAIKQDNKTSVEVTALAHTNQKTQTLFRNSVVRFVYFGLAAVVLVMFFMAASSIADGGKEIMQIQSVGGETLEEAYYAELGLIYSGYAIIARALGIFFASVLAWLGLRK